MDSRSFYDDYVERQLRVGVNRRHRAILSWLKRFGMAPGQRVLEIGCGVGTLSGLVGRALGPGGSLVGVDMSPRSVQVARERLEDLETATFLVGDALEMEIQGGFHVVVLPDVIEHIPLEDHPRLFRRVAEWLDPEGFVLLHYPNPFYLDWCHRHRPELLQPVDQPIHADTLTANVYPPGLVLAHLEAYSVWVREGDYVVAVLRHRPVDPEFHELPERQSLGTRLRRTIRSLLP